MRLAVVFGVEFAGFRGVVGGMGGVAGRDMGVMTGGGRITGFVGLGRLAVMRGGVFVVVGRLGVMFVGVVGGHGALLPPPGAM